jgi:hypothetical protein
MHSAVRSKVSKARPDSFHIIIGITPVQDALADSVPRGTRVWIVATPGLVDITGKASICARSRKAVNGESIEDILQAIGGTEKPAVPSFDPTIGSFASLAPKKTPSFIH